MSINSELDSIVNAIVEETTPQLYKVIEWALDGVDFVKHLDGDDYETLKDEVFNKVTKKLNETYRTN